MRVDTASQSTRLEMLRRAYRFLGLEIFLNLHSVKYLPGSIGKRFNIVRIDHPATEWMDGSLGRYCDIRSQRGKHRLHGKSRECCDEVDHIEPGHCDHWLFNRSGNVQTSRTYSSQ